MQPTYRSTNDSDLSQSLTANSTVIFGNGFKYLGEACTNHRFTCFTEQNYTNDLKRQPTQYTSKKHLKTYKPVGILFHKYIWYFNIW